ncbi:MAG: sugar transferase [Chloroflexales bacterium]|nr:sugar transferase [Chloroflexales bacterium]
MRPSRHINLDIVVVVASVAVTLIMLLLASQVRAWLDVGRPLTPGDERIPLTLYAVVACIWLTVLLLMAVQRILWEPHVLDGLWRLVLACMLNDLILAGFLYLFYREVPRLVFVYFALLDLCGLVVFFLLARWLVGRRVQEAGSQRRVLIAGASATGAKIAAAVERHRPSAVQIVGFLDDTLAPGDTLGARWPVLGRLSDAQAVISDTAADEVVVALSLQDHPAAVALVRRLQPLPVHIRLVPDFLDFAVMRASVDYIEGMPVVGLRVPALSDEARLLKRLFDMVVSAVLLVLFSPLLSLVALLIRWSTPGPVFYYAERVGENGRPFLMLKFRSMVEDADARLAEVTTRSDDGKLRFKHPDDPRVTRIGGWLRKTSLDELPQLINVLRGEMSLVGPRPELPAVVRDEYEPWQWSRFTVPQGMTGWWQINRRGYEHQHLCTADDLYYIQNYSIQLDLLILFRTIGVVLRGEGAY